MANPVQNTSGGTTISFSNTPQAVDDNLSSALTRLTEDSRTVVYLDVMGNDLGGKAKTLWSVDNGANNTGAMNGNIAGDLLTQDNTRTESLSSDTSINGAAIWITSDGKVGYDTGTLSANFAAKLQALAAGEDLTDSFIYSIRLGNGTLSWAAATVHFAGVNDVPLITTQLLTGMVEEQGTPNGNLTSSGTMAFGDVDLKDMHIVSAAAIGSTLGSLTATLSTDTTGTGTGGQITWNYSVPDAAVEYLAADELRTESFTVTLDDQNGGMVTRQVDVIITGTNDAPVVVAAQLTGGVTEQVTPAGDLTSTGTLAFDDVDLKDTHSVSATSIGSTLGSLTAAVSTDTTGSGTAGQITWNYSVPDLSVENLAASETKKESFTVTLDDQHGGVVSKQVEVTISGTNDAPVMALADTSGTVTAVPAASTGSGAPTPIVFTVQQYLGVQSNNLTTLRNYAAAHQADYTVQTNVIDYTDDPAGFAGELPGSSRWPAAEAQNVSGTGGINNSFFARITANFSVPAADTYTFRTYNDDGAFLMIDNQLIISDSGIHPEAPFNGSIALSPGNHSLELFFFEFGGEASLELSARNSTGAFGLLGASGGGLGGAVQVTDSGAIGFSDVDLTDAHVVSVAPVGTTVGTLTAVKASDTTGTGTGGQVDWTYAADNAKLESLTQGETKVDHFNVTVDDQHGGVTTRQVDVSMVGVNDAPIAVADSGSQKNNEVKSYAVLANDSDVDNGAVLSLAGASVAAGSGTVHVVGGQIQFDPGQDFKTLRLNETRVVNVNYTVADEHNAQATSTLAVTVIGTNTPPTAVADSLTTDEDTLLQFSAATALLANDTDPDSGDTKSIVSVGSPSHGTLVNDGNGGYLYTPAANYNGPDAFTYVMRDAAGEQSSAQVSLNVKPVNDAPVAENDTNSLKVAALGGQVHTNLVHWVNWTSNTITGTETINGNTGVIGTVAGTIDLGNGQSVNVTYSGEYQFVQTDGATTGTPPGYPYGSTEHYYYTGTNVYTSAAVANAPPDSDIVALNGANQTRTLTFTDSAGNIVPVDNLFFAVVSMNNNGYVFDQDFQVVSSGTGYWGAGTLTRVDNHNGTYTVSGTGEPHGVLSIAGSVGKLTWTSAANEFWNGFTVGTYGKALTGTATGNVLTNDSDVEHDALSVTAVNGGAITGNSITLTLASGATLNVNKDGTYLYDENGKFGALAEGQPAQETFQYTVTDTHGASSTANVKINITGVNDAPTANNDTTTTNEDTPVTISVLANDTDVDTGDSKALLSAGNTLHGAVSISGSNVIYTPAANYNGADSFTYTMKDAAGATSSATVNVTVNPVSDTYVLSNLSTNGSFEASTTGWTLTGDGVDVVSSAGWQPGDGTYSLDLNAFHPGGVQQVLQTTPGVQYTVGFDLSKNPGNTTYATVQVSAAGNSQSYTFSAGNSASNMMWSQQTFTFIATGTSTTLSFASTYPTDSTGGFPINAQGPALDEVVVFANKTIDNFSKGVGGDVLQLHDLLTSVSAPHDTTAFSGGYLQFLQSGSNTLVQIDANGGSDAYLTVATIIGQSLAQTDTPNYVL